MTEEYDLLLAGLVATNAELKPIIESDEPTITFTKARRLTAKIQKQIELLEKFKPAKGKVDTYDYANTAVPTVIQAKLYAAELSVLHRVLQPEQSNQHTPSTASHIPRSLEIKVPIFTGNYDDYPAFIEAFRVATNNSAMSIQHKFLFFRDHLAPAVRNRIANIAVTDENYPVVLEIIDDRYNNRTKIIQSLYSNLEHIPRALNTTQSLRTTYDNIETILRALELHGEPIETNVLVFNRVTKKIPQAVLFQLSTDKVPTLQTIRDRLDTFITMQEQLTAGEPEVPTQLHPPIAAAQPTLLAAAPQPKKEKSTESTPNKPSKQNNINPKPPSCAFCQADHYADNCSKYTTARERKQAMPEIFCILCLRTNHSKQDCRSKNKPCFYCKKTQAHNSAFCPQKFGYFNESRKEQKSVEVPVTTIGLLTGKRDTYLTALGTIVNPYSGERMEVRIMLDSGSGRTYATETLAQSLQLPRSDPQISPVGRFASNELEHLKTHKITFRVAELEKELDIMAETTPIISEHVPSFNTREFIAQHPLHADKRLAEPGEDGRVDILIGNDYVFHFLKLESVIEVQPNVFLIDTIFGWMLAGLIQQVNKKPIATMLSASAMSRTIKNMWELETIGIRDPPTKNAQEEDQAIEQFTTNLTYEENRYSVTLPWKNYPPNLSDNFALARGRLFSIFKKYEQKIEYLHACNKIFAHQIEEQIIEPVNETQIYKSNAHYLPFHFVLTPEKSTPLRVVYDASARSSRDANSLNDCLLKGMNLTTQIPEIMIRFRLNPIALIADIQHAFHNVGIQEADRDYLRFLWSENYDQPKEEQKIKVYRFTRVPFGCISSGFLLAATINYHLRNHESKFTPIIQRDLYIDDLVTSTDTGDNAIELVTNARALFKAAGMNLHKWNTNSDQVKSKIQPELLQTNDIVKVLGLIWHTESDTIQIITPEEFDFSQTVTMRRILRAIAQLYDPLCWAIPVTISARIFMQKLHRKKIGWNDPIDNGDLDEWKNIFKNLKQLDKIAFKRYFEGFNYKTLTLHVFSDASSKAYAAAVYVRYTHPTTHEIRTQLVSAKSRVAPLTPTTIPRLELLALLIGVRLLKFVRKSMKQKEIQAVIWSDSTCVLDWVASTHKLPTFVQNRITEIKMIEAAEFRHVSGKENPADMPSRGISASELSTSTTWWYGPSWLRRAESNWPPIYVPPSNLSAEDEQPESHTISLITPVVKIDSPFDIDESKFTRFDHLLRVTAYCIHFVRQLRKKTFDRKSASTEIAHRLWILAIQKRHYSSVIYDLQHDKKPNGIIKQLRLFIDNLGILRSRGRFAGVPQFTENQKFTILLPKATVCHYAKLIILNQHEVNLHAGTAHTLLALRRRYWVPAGRQQTYYVIRTCNACKKERALPYQQPVHSDIPECRFQIDQHPFSSVGLDIAGPLHLVNTKRWILIVTCLTTRAVALELLEDMTTPTISMAYRRIVARFSAATFILSDNAPQFVLLSQHLHRTRVEPFTWKYTVEHAPWQGACYERLIKTVKTTLFRALRAQPCCTDTQLRTILAEIEGVLNERPLTYVGENSELKPLTPNDFLKVRVSHDIENPVLPPNATDPARKLLQIWEKHNQLLTNVKKIWKTEYLQFLRERAATQNFKKQTNLRTPEIGDIVLVQEVNQKRNNWPLAVVHQIQRSSDNQVRSCVVRLATGVKIIRPVQSLYFLELNELHD